MNQRQVIKQIRDYATTCEFFARQRALHDDPTGQLFGDLLPREMCDREAERFSRLAFELVATPGLRK